MKSDHRGNQMYFRAGNTSGLSISAFKCVYLVHSNDEVDNLGKLGHLAARESI